MRFLIVVLVSLFAYGCASSQSIKPEDGTSFVITDRSYAEVWNAAKQSVDSLGAIVSLNREKGEIRGRHGISAFSWGEAIGVFINPADERSREFKVSVVSEHVVQGNIFGPDFKKTIIAKMRAQLFLNLAPGGNASVTPTTDTQTSAPHIDVQHGGTPITSTQQWRTSSPSDVPQGGTTPVRAPAVTTQTNSFGNTNGQGGSAGTLTQNCIWNYVKKDYTCVTVHN
jgi:hypothetical protein